MESALLGVLADVAAAVGDWPQMHERALSIADELSEIGNRASGRDAREAAEFLRWLVADHFTFLGYRAVQIRGQGAVSKTAVQPDATLGILRRTATADGAPQPESATAAEGDAQGALLTIRKLETLLTVHRSSPLDAISVAVRDSDDVVVEREFLGLFTHAAYADSLEGIPVLRRKVTAVLDGLGLSATEFSGRDLLKLLETYPRDEILQTGSRDLLELIRPILPLQDRRQLRLVLRYDEQRRFASCVVYLPRERYTAAVARRVEQILADSFEARHLDADVLVSQSMHAQLYFVAWASAAQPIRAVDADELERLLLSASRSWADDFADAITGIQPADGVRLVRRFPNPFPEAYKEHTAADAAIEDLKALDSLRADVDDGLDCRLVPSALGGPEELRFRVYQVSPLSLTDVLPVLRDLGFEVIDERPYELRDGAGTPFWIYEFGLARPSGDGLPDQTEQRVRSAFLAVRNGRAESDRLNSLIPSAGLEWRHVSILRAYVKYLRQTGLTFSRAYYEDVLTGNPEIARKLVDLFRARFDPRNADQKRASRLTDEARTAVDAVATLDEDRILRSLLEAVSATLRTNYFQSNDGRPKSYLALKFDPALMSSLPPPRPYREIWVYSPAVEGVHLRFGPIARGGLRWSDRREDFRVEVLGLVKAQAIKNAVIVPVGAKGGFIGKRLPDASNRDAWLAEGIASYSTFISGLLDLTDNVIDGRVVGPPDVIRADDDDPYLVVAADKGTSSFSDIANRHAKAYGYWLGDAFASGGATGYDHKAMGITARGAWESVRRHLLELGTDERTMDFTVIGIGDMSGDVFGNGMLLSPHIRLVAAFDHRHIFLDPDPDTRAAFAERSRLFALPGSSWGDYDQSLISAGGGVFPRAAKTIQLSPEVRRRLALSPETVSATPSQLISAVLRAPVDLLYNGGIGTYVKSAAESNADAGDRTNDEIRVNGSQLRCRVVAEGGNLGLTQLGRIEAARCGVRLNTDAIDNSAGVDTSDHEVNLKILLDRMVSRADLTMADRNRLLTSVADEVAASVLKDNYEQNFMLSLSRAQSQAMIPVHRRLIDDLEDRGHLDRALERLPDEDTLSQREAAGEGLTSPELSVLAAHSKIALTGELIATDLSQASWIDDPLTAYFPGPIRDRGHDELAGHPLRNEIGITGVVSHMVNRAGITFVLRIREDTGASTLETTKAYLVMWEAFGLEAYLQAIQALDGTISASKQIALFLPARRSLEDAVRWLLSKRHSAIDVGREVQRFAPRLNALIDLWPALRHGLERPTAAEDHASEGVPEKLARRCAGMIDSAGLLDVIDLADKTDQSMQEIAELYLHCLSFFGADDLLIRIAELPGTDKWSSQSRFTLRNDVHGAVADLVSQVAHLTSGAAGERVSSWQDNNSERLATARQTLEEVQATGGRNLAALSVAVRALRNLAREA